MMLFDWRRPWPLLIVGLLHGLFFYALQAGLVVRIVEAPVMREVFASLVRPAPPVEPPPIEPPKVPVPVMRGRAPTPAAL